MSLIFQSRTAPPAMLTAPAWWFIFNNDSLLLLQNSNSLSLPLLKDFSQLNLQFTIQHYLGIYNDAHCFCAEVNETALLDPQLHFLPLRKVYDVLGESLFNIAGRALQILRWDKTNQFCGRCGTTLSYKKNERAKFCTKCHTHWYPKLAPSMIVAIERDHEILLARSPHFTPGVYSTLAGFVEPGETVEETVMREVMEEVGLTVKNIRYFGSQPWPFPDSFMLAFTAEYAEGEIVVDGLEIEDAKWFGVDNLPPLPSKISISWRLIENFILKQKN